jgi:hypothetical protein
MTEPWDVEATVTAESSGCTLDLARTGTILRWMYFGDLRPLAAAILEGRPLDQSVLKLLAYMVADDNKKFVSLKDPADVFQTPYRLHAKPRHGKKGRPKEPKNFARDFVLAKLYEARVEPRKSRQVFEEIAAETGMDDRLVRLARTKHRGK